MGEQMQITINVSDEQLADTLERAGSAYWVDRLRFEEVGADGQPWAPEHSGCWHALMAGRIPRVVVMLNETHNGNPRYAVTRDSVARAVAIIAAQYPHHLGAVCGDNDAADANTGDVLLQCASLGEVVYG